MDFENDVLTSKCEMNSEKPYCDLRNKHILTSAAIDHGSEALPDNYPTV